MHSPRRGWYRLMMFVLLAVMIGGLFPDRPAYASTPSLPTARISANPNTPIVVPPAQVRQYLWSANAMGKVRGADRAEFIGFALILKNMYADNPLLSASAAQQQLNQLRTIYGNARGNVSPATMTPNESLLSLFTILTGPATANSPARNAITVAQYEAFDLLLSDPQSGQRIGADRILAVTEMYHSSIDLDRAQRAVIDDTLDMAEANTRFAQAFNGIWQNTIDLQVLAATPEILQNNPDLAAQPIAQLIDSSGGIQTTMGQMQQMARDYYTTIHGVISDAQDLYAQVDALQRNFDAYANNPVLRDQTLATVESAVQVWQDTLDLAMQATGLVADVIGFFDPELGRAIETVASAAYQIATAATDYVKAIAGLGGAEALFSMGTAALTGNIIGAVMTLLPMFMDSGPTPEQIILEEIQKLREDIQNLREEMHERFDRIDRNLNTIYETIIGGFDQLLKRLQGLQVDLRQVQIQLVYVQKQMSRFEANMHEALVDLSNRDLWQDINSGIGYRLRTGVPMPYNDSIEGYTYFDSVFHTWAVNNAKDTLGTGPSNRPLNNMLMAEELAKYPLDTNINYLNAYANAAWFLPFNTSGQPLPNPRVWSIAARAYAELQLDEPEHAFRVNQAWVDQVANEGRRLHDALVSISTATTPTGPVANRELFSAAVQHYIHSGQQLGARLDQEEQTFLVELADRLGRTGKINLWGSTGQPLDPADMPPLTLPRCGTSADLLTTTGASQLIPQVFNVARYQGLGDLSLCWDAEWINEREQLNCNKAVCRLYAQLKIWISSRWKPTGQATQTIRTRTYVAPEEDIGSCPNDPNNTNPCTRASARSRARSRWDSGLRGAWTNQATQTFSNQQLITAMPTTVQTRMRTFQAELFSRIANALNQGASNQTAAAAMTLTGAKSLLDSYIVLGLPRALEQDEYLRSFLYGQRRLLDGANPLYPGAGDRIRAMYLEAASNPTGSNPRFAVTSRIFDGGMRLQGVLNKHLDRIDNGTHREYHRLILTTLNRLAVARALARTPAARFSPVPQEFSRRMVGSSQMRPITLTNMSRGAPLAISGIVLEGDHAGDFSHTTTCGATLRPGASCAIRVSFRPTAVGQRVAQVRVVTNAPVSPHTIGLLGQGWLPAPAGNLMPNAGFELDADNNGRPDSWTNNARVTRSADVKRSGDYAMRHASNNDSTYTVRSVPITNLVAGAPLGLSAWVNIPAANDPTGFNFRLEVQWRDASNADVSATTIKTYNAHTDGTWNQTAANLVVPANVDNAVVAIVAESLRGLVYVDDIFLGNLVPNGGLEADVDSNGRPDEWSNNARVTRSDVVRRNGAFSMRHLANDNATYNITSALVDVSGDTPYVLRGSVNIPATADAFGFRIDVQWYDAGGALIRTTNLQTFTAHTNGAWSNFSSTIQAPANAVQARMRLRAEDLHATIYVDSLLFRP